MKDKGIHFEFEQGLVVARGFADLGYEEFIMLSSAKICSLYSGKISELPAEEQKHFFIVPSEDSMINRIIKLGYDIHNLYFEEQRNWKITLTHAESRKELQFYDSTIKEVLLKCLLNV